MVSRFDSFDESPLGGFVKSPLGARGGGTGVATTAMYLAGGATSFSGTNDTCYKYTPATDAWSGFFALPDPRAQAAGALGGGEWSVAAGLRGPLSGVPSTDHVRIGFAGSGWFTRQYIPGAARRALGGFRSGGRVHIAGGLIGTVETVADTAGYDHDADHWNIKSDLPAPPRAFVASATIGASGHIVGGRHGDLTSGWIAHLQDHDQYTADGDVWGGLAELPAPGRSQCAGTHLGTAGLAVFGGLTTDPTVIYADTDHYNTGGWTSKTDMPAVRYWPATATVGGNAYVHGGADATGIRDNMWEYNLDGDVWTAKTAANNRYQHSGVGH